MTKASCCRCVFDTVFVHPKPKALDVLPIIVFARANSLESIRSVRAGSSILVIRRVCDLQVQVSIYLSTSEGEEVQRHSLKGEKVFAADLGQTLLALGRQEGPQSLPVQ